MRVILSTLFLLISAFSTAYAQSYSYNQNTEVLGKVFTLTPQHLDTFSRYARVYDVGAHAIQLANPGIKEDYPDKQSKNVIIPAQFILPSVRQDIVVNLPELRLYYFTGNQVATYPVSLGKEGWKTPIRETTVTQKEKDPVWIVPDSILAEAQARGKPIPRVTPAGPHNPLGLYALHLGMPGYLIHGTNNSTSIGRRVSHGCIRMFPADIEVLFNSVPVGTHVSLINEPIKAGWLNNQLYLQVFPLLHEYPMSEADRQALGKNVINTAVGSKHVQIDWAVVNKMMAEQSGISAVIGK